MSLAYPPRFIKNLIVSKKERKVARSTELIRGHYGTFPAEIGLYYDQPGNEYLSQWFYLSEISNHGGADASRNDLYAVTFHKGLSRSLTIYSTTEHTSTPLALASSVRPYVSSASIRTAGVESDAERVRDFDLRFDGFTKDSYSFQYQNARFIWEPVPNTGARVRNLVMSPGPGDEQVEEGIVAVWREGTVPNRNKRLATLQFVDLNTAERFGDCWKLVTVCSALAICQQGAAIDGTWSWHEEKLLERPVLSKTGKRTRSQ